VSARPLAETASYWAQGGAAAALAVDDSPEIHLQDTLGAGRGLVRPSAARVVTEEAAARVRELQELGVHFDADRHGDLALGLEGGHSRRRIIHAGGSATGRRILRELSAKAAEHERIEILEGRNAAHLLVHDGAVHGVQLDDGRAITARATILATGGAAALWARTTNPPGSFGSGLLLARAAGATLADLEFTQFHPTAVTGVPGREGFLISEAVRGEGATLHGPDGERFVDELAPRDAVSRAILRLQAPVELDMTMVDPGRFPNIVDALRDAGLDPMRARVPVAPAAHYVMGGIATDLHGATTVARLYAVGECACTGLHGANRLASNSLSECFVFGRRAALAGLDQTPPAGDPRPTTATVEPPSRETRAAVWRLAGLERTAAELRELQGDPYPLARLVAACALAREETRGAHGRAEFPEPDPALDGRHTLVPASADAPGFAPWD
jgi:L-aspartate oxidase